MNFLPLSLHSKSFKPGCIRPLLIDGRVAEKIPADLIRIMPAKEGQIAVPVFFFHALY
jgi:hypothetical protein